MIKVTILVPTNYNDGRTVGQYYFDALDLWFASHFEGFAKQNGLFGCYNMSDGNLAKDSLISYSVVCDPSELYNLNRIAAKIATGLGQECIYLEWHDVNMELVKPIQE